VGSEPTYPVVRKVVLDENVGAGALAAQSVVVVGRLHAVAPRDLMDMRTNNTRCDDRVEPAVGHHAIEPFVSVDYRRVRKVHKRRDRMPEFCDLHSHFPAAAVSFGVVASTTEAMSAADTNIVN